MKSKELLEIHEAFEMFDADGDGKVRTSIKIKVRLCNDFNLYQIASLEYICNYK